MAMVQSPFLRVIERLLAECRPVVGGDPASYIPGLARANPGHFGIAVATVDGLSYCAGTPLCRSPFSQSRSPSSTGSRSTTTGPNWCDSKVGVEPSGEAFNAISLEPQTGR